MSRVATLIQPNFQKEEIKCQQHLQVVLVGRDAIYLLDPNGDVDRCIPIQDISDYILIKVCTPPTPPTHKEMEGVFPAKLQLYLCWA